MSHEFHSAVEDISHISDHSEDNNPYQSSLYCELCNIKVTSTKILQRHIEGKKHKMRLERKGKTFNCDVCKIVANSQMQLNIHLNSSKHQARLVRKECDEFTAISTHWKGILLIAVCGVCIFLNFLLLFEVIT